MIERRCLGVLVPLAETGVRAVKDVQPFGEGSHHSVLDPVVHHLHEVPCARRSTVEVAALLRRRIAVAPGCSLRSSDARRQRCEDRLELCERVVRAADHEAEAALEAEHAAARATVDVADALLGELGRTADVVAVVGVATVDDGVVAAQARCELVHGRLGDLSRRNHDPGTAWHVELGNEVVERARSCRSLGDELCDGVGGDVVDDAGVALSHQPPHDVRTHPAETDHAELHAPSLYPR